MGNFSAYILILIKYALAVVFVILFLIIGIKPTFAVNYTTTFENSPPSSYSACTSPSGCVNIGTCWNSQAPGVTDCGQACIVGGVARGNAWSKYTYSDCVETQEDPITGQSTECTSWYTKSDNVCSTADKCTSTEDNPYLNAGFCNCTTGGIYKTCCSNTTPSYVIDDSRSNTSSSCVQLAVDNTNPPWEGVCPAGSSSQFCGFGSYPACGQAACGVIPTCSNTPTNTFTQCGETCNGTTYSSTHTVSVNRYACSDGSSNYQCQDLGDLGQCTVTPPPVLNTFNITADCPDTANLSWTGPSLSASDPTCPDGYWVDISQNADFSQYSNRCIVGTSLSTQDLGGPYIGGATYYARVFNNSPTNNGHSNTRSFIAPTPTCLTYCTVSNTCDYETKNCKFTSKYVVNNVQIEDANYQRNLKPSSTISYQGWFPGNQNLEYTYPGLGPYTPTLDAKKTDGSSPVSCTLPPFSFNPPSPDCEVSLTSNGANNYTLDTTTRNMGGSMLWYYNTGTCSLPSCLNTGWTHIPSDSSPITYGTDGTFSYSWTPSPVLSGSHTIAVGTNANPSVLTCTTNYTFGVPACTLTANPPGCSNCSSLSTNLSATVDTSSMPGCKLSSWDCGDGSAVTTDTFLSHTCNYTSAGTKTPKFKVVASTGAPGCSGQDLSGTCSRNVYINTGAGGGGSSCSLTVPSDPVSPRGTFQVTIATGPAGNYTLNCPDDSTRGPADKSGPWSCSTPREPGTYAVTAFGPDGTSCSKSVKVQDLSSGLCGVNKTGSITAYAFTDPTFSPPMPDIYAWHNGDYCSRSTDTQGVSTSRVPEASPAPTPAPILDKIKHFIQQIFVKKVSAQTSCTDPTVSDSNCCGTTYIGGFNLSLYNLCHYGICSIDTLKPQSPTRPPLANVTIHADANLCFIQYTAVTDATGKATFTNIPVDIGPGRYHIGLSYTIWADPVQSGNPFTRGTCVNTDANSSLNISSPACTFDADSTYYFNGNSYKPANFESAFGFGIPPIQPWIQTKNGDVHSNDKINTPGGP